MNRIRVIRISMSHPGSAIQIHDDDEEEEEEMILLAGIIGGITAICSLPPRAPYHTSSLSGREWLQELLDGNVNRFRDQLGLNKHVFLHLVSSLQEKTSLADTQWVSVEEQVAIFLYLVVTNLSNRKLAERFQRSGDTISKCVHAVLSALTSPGFYKCYVKLPSDVTPSEIYHNPKLYPFFKDCLGAIDGTHISVLPPVEEHARYRNRKGQISINVLAACTFDMQFSYILTGWEGSACDSTIFMDARQHDFVIPKGKYYLADAGYGTCDALLVPYRGVRYHLREWAVARSRPENYKELFNLRHAQARNVIERIFGVAKKRFQMLRETGQYPVAVQSLMIPAMAVLHNFIRIHDPDDHPDPWVTEIDPEPSRGTQSLGVSRAEVASSNKCRDEIANAMWASYCRIRNSS